MAAPALDSYFVSDESRILGEIERIQRVHGRVSALMKKSVLPDGVSHNFASVITNRSTRADGGWVPVQLAEGEEVNNCVPAPSIVKPSRTRFNYVGYQTVVTSEKICFTDARAAYNFKQQVASDRENFVSEIVDVWEDQDKANFINSSGHKVILGGSLTESGFNQAIPGVAATSRITQDYLDTFYQYIIQDGGGREPYAQSNGAVLLPLVCSMEASRTIQRLDNSVREDIRFAEMGDGNSARLLQSWNVDRAFGGFMHMIDSKMPRYDFVDGDYVEVPFYINSATTIGNEAVVNPAYRNAPFEAAFIWHPDVVHRQVPTSIGSVGADTTGQSWNFNGEVQWLNIQSEDKNPFKDIGYWAARLYAAYRPLKPRYGYVLIFKRCPNIANVDCPSYS